MSREKMKWKIKSNQIKALQTIIINWDIQTQWVQVKIVEQGNHPPNNNNNKIPHCYNNYDQNAQHDQYSMLG